VGLSVQFASGRYCDPPTRSRFSVVFLDPRANAELVPRLHVALHASHAAPPASCILHIYYKIPIICVTYTRRTSGHCLGTLKTGFIVYCPPPPPKVVSLTTCPHFLSLLSSLVCVPLSLLDNNSVNMFPHQRRIVRGVVFYAILVVSKESRRVVLLVTSYILACLLHFDSLESTLLPVFILELFRSSILKHKIFHNKSFNRSQVVWITS
jgi:hypothetical protein